MKITRIELIPGASHVVGPNHSRNRFAEDGPVHLVALGDVGVAVYDDRDEDCAIFPWHRLKEARTTKTELLAWLTDPEPTAANGVAGAAKAAPPAVVQGKGGR